MNFSEQVKQVRGRLQLTQEELGKILGVSFSTVNRWEKGRHEATFLVRHKFYELCKEHEIIFDKNKGK